MLGSPSPPLPAHAYRPPGAVQPGQAFTPPTATAPQLVAAMPVDALPTDPRAAILAEWLIHHGDTWVRADDLAPAVRQMLDLRERAAAIRQQVRQLTASCPELEAKVVGNPIRHRLYRVVADRP